MSEYWTERETLEATVEHGAHSETIVVKDITKGELEKVEAHERVAMQAVNGEASEADIDDLPDFAWEDPDADVDYMESLVGEKLVEPDIDPNAVPIQKLTVLVDGMMDAWGVDNEVRQAQEEMPVEGNR